MASGKRPPGGDQRRSRPPTVINLEATEVKSGPVTNEPPPAAAAAQAEPAPGPTPKPEDAFIPPPPGASSRRGAFAWLPAELPWSHAIAGTAGALAVLLLLWLTGALTADPRFAAIEQQLHDLATRPVPASIDPRSVEDLRAQVGRLESAQAIPRAPITDPVVLSRLSSSEQAAKSLADNVAALARRSDAVEAALRDTQGRLEGMSAALNELRTVARSAAAGSDRAARLALAVGSLRAAVERGEPFTAELAAIKPLASDAAAVAALEPFAAGGVPSNARLAQELATVVKSMLRAPAEPRQDGGFLDRLQVKAESLVRVRPVGDVAGDDRDAILARIEQHAAQANVPAALADLAKLSPEARAPAQAWIAKTQARNAALDASRRLAVEAIASLKAAP